MNDTVELAARPRFHHASLDSNRLRKALVALQEAGPDGLTTLSLNQRCCSTRASSDMSELRACGVPVKCEYLGKGDSGRKIYRYYLSL